MSTLLKCWLLAAAGPPDNLISTSAFQNSSLNRLLSELLPMEMWTASSPSIESLPRKTDGMCGKADGIGVSVQVPYTGKKGRRGGRKRHRGRTLVESEYPNAWGFT